MFYNPEIVLLWTLNFWETIPSDVPAIRYDHWVMPWWFKQEYFPHTITWCVDTVAHYLIVLWTGFVYICATHPWVIPRSLFIINGLLTSLQASLLLRRTVRTDRKPSKLSETTSNWPFFRLTFVLNGPLIYTNKLGHNIIHLFYVKPCFSFLESWPIWLDLFEYLS